MAEERIILFKRKQCTGEIHGNGKMARPWSAVFQGQAGLAGQSCRQHCSVDVGGGEGGGEGGGLATPTESHLLYSAPFSGLPTEHLSVLAPVLAGV